MRGDAARSRTRPVRATIAYLGLWLAVSAAAWLPLLIVTLADR